VIFDDGTVAENVDTVIFATGYSFDFPLLEKGKLIEVKNNRVTLYKLMFPPELAPRVSCFYITIKEMMIKKAILEFFGHYWAYSANRINYANLRNAKSSLLC
jgi:hypothetical protein